MADELSRALLNETFDFEEEVSRGSHFIDRSINLMGQRLKTLLRDILKLEVLGVTKT